MSDYLFRRTGAGTAPWRFAQQGPPPDAAASPSPPVAPSWPDRALGMLRAAAVAYVALVSAPPQDAGAAPIPAQAPDRTTAAPRAAVDAYNAPLSPVPRDAGAVASDPEGDPLWPDRAPGPQRAAASAYNALLSPPVVGPWTRVQGGGLSSSAVTTLPFTLPGPVTAGDLIVVSGACGAGKTLTVSDSQGNGYQVVASRPASTPAVYVWSTQASASGSLTVTITPSSSVVVNIAVDQYNYAPRGILEPAGTVTATGSSTAPSAGPITFAGTALVYALVGSGSSAQGTTTPGAGYALRYTAQLSAGVSQGVTVEDRANDASGSATPSATFTNSVPWTDIAAVFLPAPGVSTRIACTDRAPGPLRAAAAAYAGLVSTTPPDSGAAAVPSVVAPTWPDRAPGPQRAAIEAYAGLISATPRDGGTPPIPAMLPVQAMARPRAGWYAATAGTPPDQGIVLGLPPVAPSAPDRPAGPQRAAVASYVALASATPPDGGTTPIPAALPTQAMARPRAAWYPAVTPTPPDQGVVLAPAPVAPAVPDRAPGPRRAAVNAYNALVSAAPRDAGIVPTPPPIAASAPDRARGPRRAPADVYSLVATLPLPPLPPADLLADPSPYVVGGSAAGDTVSAGILDAVTVATFRQSLRAELLALPAVTALVGNSIYPGSLPRTHDLERDGPALTYAVFRFSSGFRRHPGHNLSGSDGTVQARIRFDAWSYQYSQSDEITVALYAAFEGLSNATWGTTSVMSCIHANEVDMAEPDPVRRALIYQIVSEYDVRYRIAVPVRP